MLGHQQDRNLRLLLRSADGKLDRLPALASELVEARVDVIVAVSTPGVRAAIEATKQIPIVMTQVGDPVARGFVSNLARPTGNVTGVSNMFEQLATKRLAILKEALPAAKRIAVMFNPDGYNERQVRETERAASRLNVQVRPFPVRTPADLPETFKRVGAWHADAALWLPGQDLPFRSLTIELEAKHRLPAMSSTRQEVEAGGLISYSPDLFEVCIGGQPCM